MNSALSVEVAALPPTQENTFRRSAGHRARGDMCVGVAWRSPRPTKRGASAEVDTGPEWSLCIGCPHIGAWGGAASQTLDEMVAVGRQMQGEASYSGWVERGVCAAAAPGGVRRATARHRRLGTARGGCRSMRDADAHATARQGAVA